MADSKCFRCDKDIESAFRGDDSAWEMASSAVLMDGGGSYGSTIYDSMMDGISIRIIVCDECLKECDNKVKKIDHKVN